MKILFLSTLLCHFATAQKCGVNPFSETGRSPNLVMPNGNSCAAEAECLNNPDCYPFGGTSQFPETCANEMRVIWPPAGHTTTVVFQDLPREGMGMQHEAFTYGPPTQWDCIPASVLDCMGGMGSADVALLFGVEEGSDSLYIKNEMILDKSSYVGTVVFPLSPYGPDPIQDCIFSTGATAFSITTDRAEEHLVVVLLDTGNEDITGDIVRNEIGRMQNDSSPPAGGNNPGTPGGGANPNPPDNGGNPNPPDNGQLAPGMGPNNPLADPNDHVCPMNQAEAIRTMCTADQVGNCFYSYRYRGCTYEELQCVQDYTCDCQIFMANNEEMWRCWGSGQRVSACRPSAPTAQYTGQMCNPRAPLPQNPNPPPPVCPTTWQDASLHGCDGRIRTCEYGWHEFGCNGLTNCVPTHTCDCHGRWICAEMQHYCPIALDDGQVPVTPFTPCTPSRL